MYLPAYLSNLRKMRLAGAVLHLIPSHSISPSHRPHCFAHVLLGKEGSMEAEGVKMQRNIEELQRLYTVRLEVRRTGADPHPGPRTTHFPLRLAIQQGYRDVLHCIVF